MSVTRRILIVEDNDLTRKMVRVALRKADYEVLEAGDGAAALALLEEHSPNLVILDLHLPDMDGISLARQIRRRPAGSGIPLIAFSGLLSRIDDVRASGAGFTDFLFKPVEPSRLIALVDFYLSASALPDRASGSGYRLLLVDDDPAQGDLNAARLREFGFAVEVINDPLLVTDAARTSRPDAIVVDLLMPGMTGLELCMAIRREPELSAIPVVIASAAFQVLSEADRKLAGDIGADAFVERTPSLVAVVNALLTVIAHPRVREVSSAAAHQSSDLTGRLMRQLEHQAALSQSLARQAATQSALIAIMSSAAQVLSENRDLATLLQEVLTRALDAGGVSAGAIYLLSETGTPVLQAQVGFPAALQHDLAAAFGHAPLLADLARRDTPTEVPSEGLDRETAEQLLRRTNSESLIVAPLLAGGTSHGALVLQASSRDLGAGFMVSIAAVAGELGQAVALSRSVAQLANSEARYRMLFHGVPTGVFRSELDGTLLDVNEELVRIAGASGPEELLGTSAIDRYANPADRVRWQQELDAQGAVTDFETTLRRLDGREFWVSINVRAIRGPDSEVLYFEGTLTDITRRKEAEAALHAAQSRLNHILASSDAVIYLLRWGEGSVRSEWVTENVTRVTGHTPGDSLRPHWWDENVHPEDRDRARAISLSVRELGEATHEYRFRRADGGYIWLRDSLRLLRDAEGKPEGIVGAWVDVTTEKNLEQQFRQAQKMEAIGQLAAGVAHDFNNILTVISGYAELLAPGLVDHPEGAAGIHEIALAAKRAGLLTRQLLAFGRRQVMQPEVFDMNTAVESAARMCGRLIGEHITVELLLASHPLKVRLDPGHLEQVILNLAVNARDAMEHGGSLTITTRRVRLTAAEAAAVSLPREGEYAVLMVSDTGSGIPPDVVARIFEPFFTTKERGKGTGLGLATVYGIVRQSGGGLTVDSEVGAGTAFSAYFPISTEVEHGAALGSGTVPDRPAQGEQILLVEDEDSVRHFAATVLVRHGYRVMDARLASEALEFAKDPDNRIDLLITDVIMPGVTGPQLNAEIQVIRPGLPVIFTSGYAGDALAELGVPANAQATLEKPFSASELLEIVGRSLTPPVAPS